MVDIQIYLEPEDEELIQELQKTLPRNIYGHNFSKKTILCFLVKTALRDSKYKKLLYSKYYKEKNKTEEE